MILINTIGVSFTYASVTSKLSIDGYASMNPTRWSVHFQNLSNVNLKGTALEITKPILRNNSTNIGNFHIMFMSTNDGATYTFEVVNDGDLDAKISSVVIPKPICKEKDKNSYDDSSLVCNNFNYSLTYIDGTRV